MDTTQCPQGTKRPTLSYSMTDKWESHRSSDFSIQSVHFNEGKDLFMEDKMLLT